MVGRSKAPLFLLIGGAFLAGAAVLAWFSSVAVLDLVRTGPASVTATIESRLLGVARVSSRSIEGVRSARLQGSREPGSRSKTPDRLLFDTGAGPVDLGYDQQLFARDFAQIDAFFRDASRRDLRLSSTGGGNESFRFLAAQLMVAGLGAIGALLLGMGFRALREGDGAKA